MGVEYRRYLIPRSNSFLPDTAAIAELVSALRRERWLIDPSSPQLAAMPFRTYKRHAHAKAAGYFCENASGCVAGTADIASHVAGLDRSGLLFGWPVETLAAGSLRYPLIPMPYTGGDAEHCYYRIELHLCLDYLYHLSEAIEPFEPSPTCRCGAELTYEVDAEPFFDMRIAHTCPACGTVFDPTSLACVGRDGWTGEAFPLAGGATYRFALVVDCGKSFGNVAMSFHPDLKGLVESVLQRSMYEVADFH
jgi:hypothetical protein